MNVTEAMEKIQQITQTGLEETQVLTQITELVQFQQVDRTHIVICVVTLGGITVAFNLLTLKLAEKHFSK